MASAAYQPLPYINTHGEALTFVKTTPPIRGREIIPLGARRDADKFSIGLTPDENVEVRFFRSVILTYLKEGGLKFSSVGASWGISEAWVFENLLPQVARAKVTKGFLHVQTEDGRALVIPPGVTKVTDTLNIVEPTEHYVWRLKRAETNKVRARYGAFYRYVKGMVGVRKVPDPHYDKEFVLYLTLGEVEEAMTTEWMCKCLYIRHKPRVSTPDIRAELQQTHAGWRAAMGEFIEMVTPHESEQVQTENFYRAFLTLAACQASAYFFSRSLFSRTRNPSQDMYVSAGSLAKVLDELLFKYYSDDVFVQEKVPVGRVPDDRYCLWITRP
jgi:hypothetical protein